jgi:ELWxxDGT repeat protein
MKRLHYNPNWRPMFGVVLLVGLAAWTTPLSAQRMRIGSSNPTGMRAGTAFSGVLFASGDTTHGVELWHHSGTGNTTRLIDEYPGPISSYPTEITRRSPLTGNTWFVARTKTARGTELGRELVYYPSLPSSFAGRWVKDIRSGTSSSHPSQLTLVGPRLFFTADDGIAGTELWTSLGTIASTVRVKDILPGATGSFPSGLIAYKKSLFFAATTSDGTELWKSNGTAAGTVLVKNIRTGSASSAPGEFALFNKNLYFAATTNKHGRELWVTTGTAASTVLVADIATGKASSAPTQLTPGSQLAFTAWTATPKRELYLMDTTGVPARQSNFARGESIKQITPFSSEFFFRAYTAATGYELWRTAPASGVQIVHNLNPGAKSSFPTNLRVIGNNLVFRANDGVKGEEYWRTDGTTATLLKDIRLGPCASRPSVLTAFRSGGGTKYLFAAKADKGIELWQTNGFNATSLAKEIDAQPILPEMHWHSEDPNISIDVKDAEALRPGVIIVGTSVLRPPLALPFVRGLLAVNIAGPSVFLFFQTDSRGMFSTTFRAPPFGARTSVVSQVGVSEAAGPLALSVPGTCNQGTKELTSGGPKVTGRICLDDESGEYVFCAERIDSNSTFQTVYVGLYQRGPGGDLEFLQCVPMGVGDLFLDSGQIEILLPLEGGDMGGRHLELHLFTEPPTPTPPAPTSMITTSYC